MAMTLAEFVSKTNAEMVGDIIIVGSVGTRRIVGSCVDGAFNLNEEGQKLLAELEAPAADDASEEVGESTPAPKRRARAKAAPVVDEPVVEPVVELPVDVVAEVPDLTV